VNDAGPRLLLLTDKFAPHTGGTAVIYRHWCDRLPPGAIRVCTCWFPGWREFDAACPYRVHRVPFLNIPKLRFPLVWAAILVDAARRVREYRPQVIHAGQILETGLTALYLRRRFAIPYVVHTYGEEINTYSRLRSTRAWMRAVLRGAAAVTSISRFTAERIARFGLWEGPVSLQYPGTDSERFDGAAGEEVRRRHALGGGPVLLTVARLLERKGHDRVLEVLPAIREVHPAVRYVIVGTGPAEQRLRALTQELGLGETVVYTGGIPHDQVPSYYAAADVFVHPNRELPGGDVEGFGVVFLEANAAGLPVIGGNSGGTPDAIRDGETGFLVDPGSAAELRDGILRLLGDRALRRRLGEAGKRWAAGFTWERAAARIWELSRRVAAGEAA